MGRSILRNCKWIAWISFLIIAWNTRLHAATMDVVAGEYVVQMKDSLLGLGVEELSRTTGLHIKNAVAESRAIFVVYRPATERVEHAIAALKEIPWLQAVEPNYIYTIDALPNDPDLEKLWGLRNFGQQDPKGSVGVSGIDINAEKAWDLTVGSKAVVVAVIDTGIDYKHKDLDHNMWINRLEHNGRQGVDDDGNGWVDDIYGYDFANNDGDPMDDHGHGTHCSGTIGAEGNDGTSLVGVNWQVRLMGIKFLAGNGSGSLDKAIQSLDYAVAMGANIINASWGGGPASELLQDAIRRAGEKGVLLVAAAGNSAKNTDSTPHYPSSYALDNVISVAAIANTGRLANFSNYGNKTVDIAAPGVAILSTVPGGTAVYNGTSMAAPHVSGILALLAAYEPSLSALELKARVLNTARSHALLKGKVATGGFVDAYAALTSQLTPPNPDDPSRWPVRAVTIETDHPYPLNTEVTYRVSVRGARRMAVYFEQFATESGYDFVWVYDGKGNEVDRVTGKQDGTYSLPIEGDSATLKLVSDRSVTGFGFKISHIAYQQ